MLVVLPIMPKPVALNALAFFRRHFMKATSSLRRSPRKAQLVQVARWSLEDLLCSLSLQCLARWLAVSTGSEGLALTTKLCKYLYIYDKYVCIYIYIFLLYCICYMKFRQSKNLSIIRLNPHRYLAKEIRALDSTMIGGKAPIVTLLHRK